MKNFNPDRELNKIKYGKRNKMIFTMVFGIILLTIGYSFALYQVRHTKRIIYTTVDDFSKDINLAVYVDGIKQDDFPSKSENTIYTGIKCDNEKNINASWDYNDWSLILESNLPNKCNVYFETRYKDSSGAAYPELYQGLIPITIGSNGEIKVADLSKRWYNYDEHEWANAILIDDKTNHNEYYNEDGTYKKDTVIPIEDVLQMYVWIPRYRYKLWETLNGNSEPHMIEIEFEENSVGRSLGTNNGEWYTHPAFLFGDTELNGIWVGKFEPSDPTDANGRKNNVINEITILPDKTSMVIKTVKTMFDAERNIEKEGNKYNLDPNEVDTRMMKNSEWGAVAYLTSSKYGIYSSDGQSCMIEGMSKELCEVWINNTAQGAGITGVTNTYGGTHTGCVGESVSATVKWNVDDGSEAKCDDDKKWNTENGVKASTTGNMYGIYDMAGGAWEYMMGVLKTQDGTDIYYVNSGFNKANMPDPKYYDLYEFSASNTTHERGHLGDATRETLTSFGNTTGGWNSDYAKFPSVTFENIYTWFGRGGCYDDNTYAGTFAFLWNGSSEDVTSSFRSVVSRT